MALKPLTVLLAALSAAGTASAQSFFATLAVDPVVGVDRGSASRVQELDDPATFLTFSTTGSKDAGPVVLGIGLGRPDFLLDGDQLDVAAVVAGPSAEGGRELVAGGVSYRLSVGDNGATTAFAVADYGDLLLGSEEALALDARGDRLQLALGARHDLSVAETGRLSVGAEIIARHVTSQIFGTTVIDEELRLLRASLGYSDGLQFGMQRRATLSLTKGFSGAGASPRDNFFASVPGATTDFERAAFSLEGSLPFSARLVANAGIIGQWTEDSLPASQRCGFGTNNYARGFDYSFVNGDRCVGGRVELAYNMELPRPSGDSLIFTQGYVGIDGGSLENVANRLGPGVKDGWSSLSAGVRSLRGNFIGEVAVTRILDAPDSPVNQDDTRVWIQAAIKF